MAKQSQENTPSGEVRVTGLYQRAGDAVILSSAFSFAGHFTPGRLYRS
jgi:hypothetical protein